MLGVCEQREHLGMRMLASHGYKSQGTWICHVARIAARQGPARIHARMAFALPRQFRAFLSSSPFPPMIPLPLLPSI